MIINQLHLLFNQPIIAWNQMVQHGLNTDKILNIMCIVEINAIVFILLILSDKNNEFI